MTNDARRMPRRPVGGIVDVVDTLTGERIGHLTRFPSLTLGVTSV